MKKCMAYFLGGVCLLLPCQAWALSEADFMIVSARYGLPQHLLRAISIIESQQGQYTGAHQVSKVVSATQLKYLKKIARATKRQISDFTGSSAGAMGYMQIIPSTFYLYAQDGDGDGVKDPLNPYDSLATAAYFLARRLARRNSMRDALRGYNNSAAYCANVEALYRKLEATHAFASR